MSTALEQIKKLGFELKELKSAADLKSSKFNTTVDNLCAGEVGSEFAAGLFDTETDLYAFKIVKKGDAKSTVGVLMFVNPMRAYDASDDVAKVLKSQASYLGFDQAKQAGEALELLVFCVDAKARRQKLGSLMLQHAIEVAQKKFIVIGQELGPASDAASKFYEKLFQSFAESERGGKKFRYYVGLSDNVLAALKGEKPAASKPAASKPAASKPAASKPAAPKVAVGKRRRAGTTCQKTVARSNSFLNAVGRKFKAEKDLLKVESTLSMQAACAVDAILRDTLEKLGETLSSLLASSHSKTVDVRTVKLALKIRFGTSELGKFMTTHGESARVKFNGNNKLGKKGSRAERAGLIVAPARVVRLLREARVAQRFGLHADILLAGALDYLAQDLLNSGLNLIKQSKAQSGRLTPRILMLSIQGDEELSKYFRGSIGRAGVPVTAPPAKKAK